MLIRKFKTEQTGENFVIIFWGGMKNNEKILLNVEFLTREFKIRVGKKLWGGRIFFKNLSSFRQFELFILTGEQEDRRFFVCFSYGLGENDSLKDY